MQQPEQISPTTTSRFDKIVEFTVTQDTPVSPEPTDDWTLLREAIDVVSTDGRYIEMIESSIEFCDAVDVIVTMVPRLLDAYADLWELSIALTKAVEQWKAEGQGGKLLVADEQEVRQFN